MKKIRMVTTWVLLSSMILTALGGCSSGGSGAETGSTAAPAATSAAASAGETTETTAAAETSEEPVHLSMCASSNEFGVCADEELQQAVVDLLESKTNTEIEAIIPPSSSYNDKLETMISGGDIPDVFYVSQAMNRLPRFAVRGKLLRLNDYIANSEKLSAIPQEMYDALAIDGNIYHVPYRNPKAKVILMRKDIMDEYGIELSHTPTTEEFVTEMSKLKGTGIIPMCFASNYQFFMNSFGAYAGIYKNEAGQYVDGFQEPQMMDALKYMRRLYEEGIIDQEFITTVIATTREYMYSGQAAANLDYTTRFMTYVSESKKLGKETEFYPIYCLYGPDGQGGCLNESIQIAMSISAACENPDKAVEVLETLIMDPEMYSAFFDIGVEGYHYTVDDEGHMQPTEKATNSGYTPSYAFLYDSYLKDTDFDLSFKLDDELEAALPQQLEIVQNAKEVMGPNYMVPSGKSELYDESSASIVSTWQEIVSQVVLGSVTPEEGMENYKNFWNSIDGDTILEELNK